TNQRLSSTLRRLLDRHAYQDRQRVSVLLRDIRQTAATVSGNPPTEVGVDVETQIEISSPLSRTFWSEPQTFSPVDLVEHVSDDETRAHAFLSLAKMQRLDWRGMRRRVQQALLERETVTLGEFLVDNPPSGVVDVVGYMQIARDDGHFIDPDATDQ